MRRKPPQTLCNAGIFRRCAENRRNCSPYLGQLTTLLRQYVYRGYGIRLLLLYWVLFYFIFGIALFIVSNWIRKADIRISWALGAINLILPSALYMNWIRICFVPLLPSVFFFANGVYLLIVERTRNKA